MSAKRKGSVRTSLPTSEPPEITDQWIAGADLYRGDNVVRRGRPKLEHPRKLLSLRLPPDASPALLGWPVALQEILDDAHRSSMAELPVNQVLDRGRGDAGISSQLTDCRLVVADHRGFDSERDRLGHSE